MNSPSAACSDIASRYNKAEAEAEAEAEATFAEAMAAKGGLREVSMDQVLIFE